MADYRSWQREPEIIDEQVSPEPLPANAAGPDTSSTSDGPAADIPTAADYWQQWETMIQGATHADQIKRTWNDQTALRKSINWTSAHSFSDLQAKVKRAIDFLQPA